MAYREGHCMSTRISFAWWNTSLSPVRKRKRKTTDEERAVALEVVQQLTLVMEIDCLALGEVTAEDVLRMRNQGGLTDYDFVDGTLKTHGLQFDTGVLFRRDTLSFVDFRPLYDDSSSQRLKVANRIDFVAFGTRTPLHVFVSHWPSLLWCEENGATRQYLGVRLRDAVNELPQLSGDPAHAILLRDFNCEPFDNPLADQLLATRDRERVRNNQKLLYNPFWRCLGEAEPYVPGNSRRSYCGSFFYSKGVNTRWRTFDQIILSSSFLGHSEWRLNEHYTTILPLSPLDTALPNKGGIFDHFPVISVIERELNHD
jgi:hypothetical protein